MPRRLRQLPIGAEDTMIKNKVAPLRRTSCLSCFASVSHSVYVLRARAALLVVFLSALAAEVSAIKITR